MDTSKPYVDTVTACSDYMRGYVEGTQRRRKNDNKRGVDGGSERKSEVRHVNSPPAAAAAVCSEFVAN